MTRPTRAASAPGGLAVALAGLLAATAPAAAGPNLVDDLIRKFDAKALDDAAEAAKRAAPDAGQVAPGGNQIRRLLPPETAAKNLPPPPAPFRPNLPPPPEPGARTLEGLFPNVPVDGVDNLGAVRRTDPNAGRVANDGTIYLPPETVPLGGANRPLPTLPPRQNYDVVPALSPGSIFYDRFLPVDAATNAPRRVQAFASADGLPSTALARNVPPAPVRVSWSGLPKDLSAVRIVPPTRRGVVIAKVAGGLVSLAAVAGGVTAGYIYRDELEDSARNTFDLPQRDPDDPTPGRTIVLDGSGTMTRAPTEGLVAYEAGTAPLAEPAVSDRPGGGGLPKTVRVVVQNTLTVPLEVAFVAPDGSLPLIELINPGLERPIHMPGGAALAFRANSEDPDAPYRVYAPQHAVTKLRAGWVLGG